MLLEHKDQVYQAFENYYNQSTTMQRVELIETRSDREGEFIAKTIADCCCSKYVLKLEVWIHVCVIIC